LFFVLIPYVLCDDAARDFSFNTQNNGFTVDATSKTDQSSATSSSSNSKEKNNPPNQKGGSTPIAGVPTIGQRTQDRVRIQADATGSGLKMHLYWYEKTADSKEMFNFHAYMDDVIEYNCTYACGPTSTECCPYKSGDGYVAEYPLTSWQSPPTYVGCQQADAACSALFATTDNRFQVTFRINTAGLASNGIALSTNDIKVDIQEQFLLTQSNTALAIRGRIESVSDSHERSTVNQNRQSPDSQDATDTDTSTGVSGTFLWVSNIDCGGVNNVRTVKTSGVTDNPTGAENGGNCKAITWSILKQQSDTNACIWDPVLQYTDSRFCAQCYALFFLLGSIVLCCCCLCAGWYCWRRRRGKVAGSSGSGSAIDLSG